MGYAEYIRTMIFANKIIIETEMLATAEVRALSSGYLEEDRPTIARGTCDVR